MTTTIYVGSISAWGLNGNEDGISSTSHTCTNSYYFGDISANTVNTTDYIEGLSNSAPTFRGDGLPETMSVGAEFESIEEAEAWYKKHAKFVGFSVRKDVLCQDNKSGKIASRTWVCSGQGYRMKKWIDRTDAVRESRGITRNGCLAAFRVNYNHSLKRYVSTKFIDGHTHKLVAADHTQFLHSHRHVNYSDFGHAKALREVGVKVCQYIDYKSDLSMFTYLQGFKSKAFSPPTAVKIVSFGVFL